MHGATYVSDSGNSKLNGSKPIDATYVSIESSCPSSCPLKSSGCYAQSSFTGITVRRLDTEAKDLSILQVARAEAKAIDQSYKGGNIPKGRDLRIHVSGDSRSLAGTRIINKAISRWIKRGGGTAFSYTHAWRHVPRDEWSNVSILASISNVKEASEARKQGYAPAIVVAGHPSDKAYYLEGSNVKWIPCVQQTRGVGCSDCRLCFDANRLYKNNMGIAFAAHGVKKNEIKKHLKVIQ